MSRNTIIGIIIAIIVIIIIWWWWAAADDNVAVEGDVDTIEEVEGTE